MIQRIQTVYMLLAAVLLAVGAIVGEGGWLFSGLMVCMSLVAITIIFLFKNRPLQANLCVVLMLVGIVYYIVLAVKQPIMDWTNALPLVAVLLAFLARKRILKDEKLVRSLDRIR